VRDRSSQWSSHLWAILMIGCLLGFSACADLMSESEDGNTAAVQKDLAHGSNPDQVDDSGVTPLVLAAQNGHYDAVKLLLEYGADPNLKVVYSQMKDSDGMLCDSLGDYHLRVDGKDRPGCIIHSNDVGPAYVWIEILTPLSMAAQNKHYDVVKLLLEYGADPEVGVEGSHWRMNGQQAAPSLSLDQLWATAAANGIPSSQIDSLRKSYSLSQDRPTQLIHQLFPENKISLLRRARGALPRSISGKAKEFYRDLNRPQSKNFDAYNNEYLWTKKGSPILQKWGSSFSGKSGFQFLAVSEQIIQGDYLEEVWDRMKGVSLPELDIKQSKFESTRHYLHREESTKEELNSYRNTLLSNERKAYKAVELREKLIVYRFFVLYFGRPIITNISYDPDTRLFGIRVEGKNGIFRFTLADRIMNEVAPAYEKKIMKASVKILLRASGGRLYIDGGSLLFPDGTSERILPFHEEDYHPKDVTIASFPKIKVPKFSPPEKILSNERMKSEGKKIVRDTVYFQGLK